MLFPQNSIHKEKNIKPNKNFNVFAQFNLFLAQQPQQMPIDYMKFFAILLVLICKS
jgi:hypothetical protein